MHLELSISPCPNDTFMFDALLGGRIDCEGLTFAPAFHDIEELNRALRGAAPGAGPDMSKVSCALLPEIADRYEVLDSGAALGRGNGPLLVRRRGDRTPLRHVAVPGLHTTANALLRLLHPEIMERTPVLFSEIAAAVERGDYDAGVLIHEGRFVFGDRNLERVADLGEEWEARTGLPLPLGAIVVVRKDAAPSKPSPPALSEHPERRTHPPPNSCAPAIIYRSRAPCPAHSRMRPVRKPRPARTPPQRTECEKSSARTIFPARSLDMSNFSYIYSRQHPAAGMPCEKPINFKRYEKLFSQGDQEHRSDRRSGNGKDHACRGHGLRGQSDRPQG